MRTRFILYTVLRIVSGWFVATAFLALMGTDATKAVAPQYALSFAVVGTFTAFFALIAGALVIIVVEPSDV